VNEADPSRVVWTLGHDVVTLMRTYRAVLPYEGKKLAQQLEVILTEPVAPPSGDTEGGQELEDGA
jgi:hypothetical protein